MSVSKLIGRVDAALSAVGACERTVSRPRAISRTLRRERPSREGDGGACADAESLPHQEARRSHADDGHDRSAGFNRGSRPTTGIPEFQGRRDESALRARGPVLETRNGGAVCSSRRSAGRGRRSSAHSEFRRLDVVRTAREERLLDEMPEQDRQRQHDGAGDRERGERRQAKTPRTTIVWRTGKCRM